MTSRSRTTAFALACVLAASSGCGGQQGDTPPPATVPTLVAHAYPKNDGPSKNPHKGWNSGWWNVLDEATVGFQYVPWKDFEPVRNQFNYAAVEDVINRPGSAGKHVILRLYCEFSPGDVSSCPDWIYASQGVRRIVGDDGTALTDFNDARYIDESVIAIQALAAHYDHDPRVHAFQLGVLGYWGEWHTTGFKVGGHPYQISGTAFDAVLNAYRTGFKAVPLQRRYPSAALALTPGMGFHNDWFVANDADSDAFDQALAGGLWKGGPVGGEVPPMKAEAAAAGKQAMYASAKGASMIAAGHYSTMQPGAYQVAPGDPSYASYMKLHKMMGYNYQVEAADFADSLGTQDAVSVRVTAKNIGVAPLYHDWQVQFALLDSHDLAVAQGASTFDLKSAQPGDLFTLSGSLDPHGLSPANYRLAVRLIQPGADVAKPAVWKLDARNTYILFANDMPVVDGNWGSDNALKGGWSVLGSVAVH